MVASLLISIWSLSLKMSFGDEEEEQGENRCLFYFFVRSILFLLL